jgi:soluble lytic murein transglycosylase-like protein
MNPQNAWVMRLPWSIIEDVADEQNVPANLLGAIVQTESSNNKWAIRFEPHYKYLYKTKENAQANGLTEATEIATQMMSFGLCQLMGAVGRELGLKGTIFQLLDEKTNLEYAAKLLKRLASRWKERDDIIAAYNAGSPIQGLNGLYKNQGYVDKVNLHLSAINLARNSRSE